MKCHYMGMLRQPQRRLLLQNMPYHDHASRRRKTHVHGGKLQSTPQFLFWLVAASDRANQETTPGE